MARPKKQTEFEDDEMFAEDAVEREVPAGENGAAESATDPLSDDDLTGEPEPREPEQADSAGSETDATGSVVEDVGEDTPQLPDEFMTMDKAPLSGIRIMVFTPAGEYLRVFCKRSRRFIDRRWQMSEKWCDAVTGKDIEFEPLGWRSLKAGE